MESIDRSLRLRKMSCLLIVWFVFSLALACKKENIDEMSNPDSEQPISCDTTLLPVVMIHGMLASGDTYAMQAMRFESNGWCPGRMFTFDWNTLGGGDQIPVLDAFIDEILANTKSKQVILAGHSAGSNLGYNYCNEVSRAQKVAYYIHLAGTSRSKPAGPEGEVVTLNIWSSADPIVQGGNIPGAVNIQYDDLDHYQVATSGRTFKLIYQLVTGKEPVFDIKSQSGDLVLAGRAVTLGENRPMTGAQVEVYEVDHLSGWRKSDQPVFSSLCNQGGYWGPFQGKSGVHYEFTIKGTEPNDRRIHYYRQPFQRSNSLIYLRGLPPPSSPAGILLSGLPKDDRQSVLAIFASNQAVIAGRDTLTFEDTELSTGTLSPASSSNIAYFLYDANNNQRSDNTPILTFSFVPFLAGVDQFISAQSPAHYTATLNGQSLAFRNWRSNSDGIIVLVFD